MQGRFSVDDVERQVKVKSARSCQRCRRSPRARLVTGRSAPQTQKDAASVRGGVAGTPQRTPPREVAAPSAVPSVEAGTVCPARRPALGLEAWPGPSGRGGGVSRPFGLRV